MFFRAQNLGPIRDAEVDLSKDLIVLAGPNNAGKTYLAWSVYGLHRARPARSAVVSGWARQLLASADHTIDLDALLAQEGPGLLEGIAKEYASSLHLCFAAESARFAAAEVSLRGAGVRDADPLISFTLFGEPKRFSTLYAPRLSPTRVSAIIVDGGLARPLFDLMKERAPFPPEFLTMTHAALASLTADQREGWEKVLERDLLTLVLSKLFRRCTIFPAERIAVNIFAKELSLKRTELVDEMVDAELDDQRGAPLELIRRKAGRYPWPIRDSLRVAGDLANLSKEKGPFAPLADELESAVLGGAVTVSEAGEMLFAPRGDGSPTLQMHLTASMVKSLSSLVFYFRYLARKGDLLIVDEPELNLHPDNQRKITRVLAKAVGLGFKVMISTHSDYVLRELNHLIMLSKLPEGEAQGLGYDSLSALSPERVGVYLFDQGYGRPVPVEETGFAIRTIDEVVNQLNADEQRLYARLSG